MNTTSATRTGDMHRPLILRVARKWYSWASLALTVTAVYLALDGQLKLGGQSQLQAAPPMDATPVGDVASKTDGLPDPAPMPPKPLDRSPVERILKNYVDSGISQASFQEVAGQDGPKITIPPVGDEKAPPPDVKEPVKAPEQLVEPTPIKPVPKQTIPNIPVPLPPKKVDVPGLAVNDDKTAVKKPDDSGPAPKDDKKQKTDAGPKPLEKGIVQPEPIPTLPTPEAKNPIQDAASKALAAEVETLNPSERLLYDGAIVEMKLKNFPVAIERYEALLRLRPDLLHIRAEFAGILITAGEMAKAIEQYKRLVERAPSSVEFRIRLGDAYVINRQYREAIANFMEALRLSPNEPEYAVRLARAYAFDNDFLRATDIYERYLAKYRPDDRRAPAALGALLLDLERPAEALPFLLAKRRILEKTPKDPLLLEVLSNLVRAYARLGERGLAMEVLNDMHVKFPENTGVRLVLGNTLVTIDEFELAGQVFNQVLQADQTNGAALIGLARVHLEMFNPMNARRILDSFIPAVVNQRAYLLTYAAYHEKIGEYIEAKQIYKDMLRRNPFDHEIRYALGALLEYIRESEKAKGEFAKIPPTGALGKRARLYFAQTLASQRKFLEAADVAKVLIVEDPNDASAIAAATRYLGKAGKYPAAIELARGYLVTNPKSEQHALAVRLALARVLYDSGHYLESSREYEIALAKPSGRVVASFYGLARASEKLGNPGRATQLLGCIAGLPGGDVRNRMLLADQYNADFEDMPVIDLCVGVLHGDPENLAVMIRLVDAQQRQSRFSGNPADAFETCLRILKLSPTNVRGHLAMSRSFAVAQNYRKAAAAYDNIIRIDPEFTIPARERARILYSDKQYSAARSQYNAILQMTPDDVIVTQLNSIVQRDPKLKMMFAPYVMGKVTGPILRQEMARLAACPDEDVRLVAQGLLSDYDATAAWQKAFTLERDAKELKNYRDYEAMPAYDAAVAFEPTNTEAIFDYAQTYAARNWTQKEVNTYSQLLDVDPTNRDAMVASQRAQAEMGPKGDFNESFFYQRGRNGLANIDRNKMTWAGRVPLGDENEFLQIGYTWARYTPTGNSSDNSALNGNIPYFRVQKRFMDDRLLYYGQLNIEEYANRISTKPTFDTGFNYYCNSWITARGGLYLENVVENGESMVQNIYRYGFYAGVDLKPTRLWGLGGEYRYAHYSDNNDLNQFTLYNENSFTLPPKQLKLVERVFFMGYREQSIFPTNPPDPNDIAGTVHPYFSPRGFAQTEVRLEWWHWLSRDYFAHANACWYTLQYGVATDNTGVIYENLRAALNYDVCTWFTVGTDVNAQLSSVYNMFSAMAYLQIRFR